MPRSNRERERRRREYAGIDAYHCSRSPRVAHAYTATSVFALLYGALGAVLGAVLAAILGAILGTGLGAVLRSVLAAAWITACRATAIDQLQFLGIQVTHD